MQSDLPPIPILLIQPSVLSDEPYMIHLQKKHLRMLNGERQYGSTKQQVDNKLKHRFDKSEQQSTNTQSTGQQKMINLTIYSYCSRCSHWILQNQMSVHQSCHAAIIMDNLLLGDKFCSQSRKQLIERLKVTHIVNAANQLRNHFQHEGVLYKNLTLYDNLSEQLIDQMLQACQFIKQAHDKKGKVFVHCAMGKSRSASVIIVYLMKHFNMNLKQSLQFVKQKRPLVKPNINYMRQLEQFAQKIKQNQ